MQGRSRLVPKCVSPWHSHEGRRRRSVARGAQQPDEYQTQPPQKPLEGPPDVPLMHENVSLQNPHVLMAVQSVQVPALAHGSADAQLDQCQSLQNPLEGPPDVPVEHVPVSLQ